MKRIAILLLAVSMAGCAAKNTTVTNLPAGVTQAQVANWTNAVNDLQQAQSLTHGGVTTVIALNRQTPSVFPDGPAYAATLGGLGKAEQIEIQAATFLKTVPNNWSASTSSQVLTYSTQILAQLSTAQAQGAIGIKAPASVTAVTNIINQVVTLINLVKSLATAPTAQLSKGVQLVRVS